MWWLRLVVGWCVTVSSGSLRWVLCGSLGVSLEVMEWLFTNSNDFERAYNSFGMVADDSF